MESLPAAVGCKKVQISLCSSKFVLQHKHVDHFALLDFCACFELVFTPEGEPKFDLSKAPHVQISFGSTWVALRIAYQCETENSSIESTTMSIGDVQCLDMWLYDRKLPAGTPIVVNSGA